MSDSSGGQPINIRSSAAGLRSPGFQNDNVSHGYNPLEAIGALVSSSLPLPTEDERWFTEESQQEILQSHNPTASQINQQLHRQTRYTDYGTFEQNPSLVTPSILQFCFLFIKYYLMFRIPALYLEI